MRRWLATGTCAVCVLGTIAAGQQQPVFRGTSDTVRVFVTVTDADGRLVTTLERGDFEVRDEGKAQPIILFDNTPQPIRLVVMLDVSGSMVGNLTLLRGAAEGLFARLGADDTARVGTFGHAVTISPTFTRDVSDLRRALPESVADDAPTPLWRSAALALDAFQEDDAGPDAVAGTRPVILILSDGKDSGVTFRGPMVSQAEIIDRARRQGVMIYAVGMRSRGNRAAQPGFGVGGGGLQAMLTVDLPDAGLARVAEETGGGYVEIRLGEDLGAAFARVADELHSQYLLGFEPPKRDGKTHDVDVRVSGRGLKARARKDYVAPKD